MPQQDRDAEPQGDQLEHASFSKCATTLGANPSRPRRDLFSRGDDRQFEKLLNRIRHRGKADQILRPDRSPANARWIIESSDNWNDIDKVIAPLNQSRYYYILYGSRSSINEPPK